MQNNALPSNWQRYTLGEIYTERKEPGNDSLPVLSVSIHSGVSDGELDEEELGKKIKRIQDKSQYRKAMKGDLVFNMMRAWQGAIGVVRTDGQVSPAYIVARPNEKVYPPFMDYYMKTPRMIHAIHRQSYGVTDFRLRLYWDSFAPIHCVIPPVEEQKKIAEILAAQDRVIALYDQKIEQLRLLKKYCLLKMFPKRGSNVPEVRFPGFTNSWEQHKLVDVFDFLQNNTLSRADLNPEKGAAQTVHYGDILVKYGEYLDASDTSLPYISSQQIVDVFKNSFLQDGDVIMADTAEDETAGKCAEITGLQGFPTISGLHTIPLRPKKKFASGYLGYYMNSGAYHKQLLPLMQGIKVTSISKSAIQNTEIMFPLDKAEQSAVARYFIQLDTLIALHQRKQEAEKQKKRAQIQLLIAGLVRIL